MCVYMQYEMWSFARVTMTCVVGGPTTCSTHTHRACSPHATLANYNTLAISNTETGVIS